MKMRITSQEDLENAVTQFGVLPFFRNNIRGFSIEEMTPPGLLFGGNEYEGCWEWKGPVVRRRTSAYGKFFRRKAGFVSLELLPFFLKYRRSGTAPRPGTTEEMIHDIISINDKMTSTDLREALLGKPKRRTAFDLPDLSLDSQLQPSGSVPKKKISRHTLEAPLQRLQMGGWLCISDFRYKTTRKGEHYGWGVAEYSTPEMLFPDLYPDCDIEGNPLPEPTECLDFIVTRVMENLPGTKKDQIVKLLSR